MSVSAEAKAMRAALETALWNLTESALSDADQFIFATIGELTLNGINPCKSLGTTRRRGRPIIAEALHQNVSHSFWVFRANGWTAKAAKSVVGQYYGISPERVYKIAFKHRDETQSRLKRFPTNSPFEDNDPD